MGSAAISRWSLPARRLHVHPQTIRYRLRQVSGLFGDALTDPDARFRLLLALRVRQLLAGAEAATKYSHASDTEAGPAVSMVEVFNRKDTTWTNSEILKA
jgi:PucR C-terminal helix-turn-helix domain